MCERHIYLDILSEIYLIPGLIYYRLHEKENVVQPRLALNE